MPAEGIATLLDSKNKALGTIKFFQKQYKLTMYIDATSEDFKDTVSLVFYKYGGSNSDDTIKTDDIVLNPVNNKIDSMVAVDARQTNVSIYPSHYRNSILGRGVGLVTDNGIVGFGSVCLLKE
jgi:hypothetical protein